MRTTVDLYPDVVEGVRAVARKRGVSFKKALNEIVRLGLVYEKGGPRPFKQMTWPMGPARFDLTKALSLAAELEDEENLRRMQLATDGARQRSDNLRPDV
jgi:hypothetical protein